MGRFELWRSIGLAALSCCLSLLFLEGILRGLERSRGMDTGSVEQYVCQYDPLLGWRGIPDLPDTAGMDGRPFNALGFRDVEHAVDKPAGVRRVLVLGDSFTWGFNVSLAESYPRLLQESLGPGWEVISTGIPGYSTDQEVILLEREGLAFAPDVIVLQMFLDDLYYNGSIATHDGKYPKPLFSIENGELVLGNVPVPDLRHASRLLGLVHRRLYRLRTRVHVNRHLGGREWYEAVFSPEFAGTQAYRATEQLIREAQRLSLDRGARLVLVIVPTQEQVFSGGDFPQARLLSFASARGIAALDLRRWLKADDYLDYDLHWNANGHRVAAAVLGEYLRR